MKKTKVAVNGYGVIGKRVADAVTLQDDMELAGVCNVITDWRIRMAEEKKYPVFAFDETVRNSMKEAGIGARGILANLLETVDIVVDCTPKKIAAQNITQYRKMEKKFIVHRKKEITG